MVGIHIYKEQRDSSRYKKKWVNVTAIYMIMYETHNKMPNCTAEKEQVQSSNMIYKMQKELQVNKRM